MFQWCLLLSVVVRVFKVQVVNTRFCGRGWFSRPVYCRIVFCKIPSFGRHCTCRNLQRQVQQCLNFMDNFIVLLTLTASSLDLAKTCLALRQFLEQDARKQGTCSVHKFINSKHCLVCQPKVTEWLYWYNYEPQRPNKYLNVRIIEYFPFINKQPTHNTHTYAVTPPDFKQIWIRLWYGAFWSNTILVCATRTYIKRALTTGATI